MTVDGGAMEFCMGMSLGRLAPLRLGVKSDRALRGYPNWIGFFDRGSSYRPLAAAARQSGWR